MRLGLRACAPALVVFALACGNEDDKSDGNSDDTTKGSGGSDTTNDNTNGSTGGSGGSDASGGSNNAGGSNNSGGSGDAGGSGGSANGGNGGNATNGGGANGNDSTSNNQTATTGISPIPGDPGCGLDSAAFCDNFDAPSNVRGRAGELDAGWWSASRGQPQWPTMNMLAYGIGPATLPACRADLPAQVFPDDDSPICDPTEQIHSNHLLSAVAAQNYGQNSYRIRQPFDFSGRTGKIVFDAEGFMPQNIGWASIAVTEDPAPYPSYSLGTANNDEGGTSPRRGFLVIFHNCPTGDLGVRLVDEVDNYEDIEHTGPQQCPAIPTQQGALHHFEVTVSQNRIEVYASKASADGVEFGDLELLHAADVDLPFSRGYVYLTLHNHASIKYSADRFGETYDSWFARWDNVGFDGPVVENWREYEVPDAKVAGHGGEPPRDVQNIAYLVADESMGPRDVLEFQDVDLSNVVSARLALGSWYLIGENMEDYLLKYRLNGGSWHERSLTEGEIALLNSGNNHGQLSQVLDVPVDDLVNGTNTLEFVTVNVPQNYPPAVSAIDLVLTTD